MALRVIENGRWQDAEGNALSRGYLTFRLNTDGQSGVQIAAGRLVVVPLDSFGNIAGSPSIWTNDTMTPVTTYTIIAYTNQGQAVWRDPKFTLPTGVGPYDFGGEHSPEVFLLETGIGHILLEDGGSLLLE